MPFSGTANGANATLNIILRYMIAPIMIGLLLLARSFDNGTPLRRGWIGLVMILAMIPYQNKYMHCGQVLCVIALVGLSYYGWKKIRPISQSYSIPKWIPVLLLTSLLTGWSLCLPYQQEKTDRNLYRFGHDPQRPIGAAWKALETLPPASKITWFGPGAYLYYPLFGRNLQFNPIKINSQGPYQPLHIRWQKDPDSVKWWKKKTPPNPSQLIHQLTTQPVDYILITQWNKHEWPAENDIIATSNKFQPIYNDDYSIIWKKKTD